MKLYFKDTAMMYREISELLNSHIGPAGPKTWQNGVGWEKPTSELGISELEDYYGDYIEIYNNHPAAAFVKLKW